MSGTRGPCKCKWCPGEAIPRSGLVQVCTRCQVRIDMIARATREEQLRDGLSDPVIASRFGIVPDTWRRIRRSLRDRPNDELVTASIDPALLDTMIGDDEAEPRPRPTSFGDWWNRAACLDEDPEMFFPTGRKIPEETAKVCSGCGVRSACEGNAGSHGVWGGRLFVGS